MRTLQAAEARSFYDRFGAKQDQQGFYEERALQALVAHAALAEATSVFEFGCGTGRFALELLEHHLAPSARYAGVDISATMVELATRRLAAFASRASVALSAGATTLPLADHEVDRFVSTYVLDLLSEPDQRALIAEAHRVLRRDGLLCLAGITGGASAASRVVMGIWQRLFALNPRWTGGCRPCRALDYLPATQWTIRFHTVVVAWGVASEVVVAAPAA